MPQYLLFHKPYNVLTQFSPEPRSAAPTLKDYIAQPEVYPAGRLDRDSEGLVLLTDDGWLQHELTDPRFAHPRTYWAQVEGVPDVEALRKLERSVEIQGYRTRPAKARLLPNEPDLPPRDPPIRFRRNIPTAWLEIVLREGRNRQVRRMTAAVGYPTLRLVRVAIGHLKLDGLRPGEWRELASTDIQPFRIHR